MKELLRITVVLMVASAFCALAQTKVSTVLGTWKGESKCTVKPSACQDEIVVYDIQTSPDKERLLWRADKIVKGERQNMGALECSHAAETRVLTCYIPGKGVWSFQVHGDTLTGTLKLADGTLFRKVSAKRVAQ